MTFPSIRGGILIATLLPNSLAAAQPETTLPILNLPDKKIAEVYRANWLNTLQPCTQNLQPPDPSSPHAEPRRPWKVDVNGHYPGWYPGVDVKHQAAAYLACGGDLPLVLRAWDLTSRHYMMDDGGVKPSTMHNNPHGIWPEATSDNAVVYYPLRIVATIDYLILGDMIFRYSQDRKWLEANLTSMHRARDFLAGWVDNDGLLLSHSYDLDQVYREIDGVAQASAYFALQRLARLDRLSGDDANADNAQMLARKLKHASNQFFWNEDLGYYSEHLAYHNVARSDRQGSVAAVSSQRIPGFAARKAIDGVVGIGVDAFGVGIGAAGNHEWSTDGETTGAWIQINLKRPATVSKAILVNRTGFDVKPGERFAKGYLEFSDGSPRVEVSFNNLTISRAVVSFGPRQVRWVKFVGTKMQGDGGKHAGLSEFSLVSAEDPHRRFSHGMTDTNFAMVAFGIATEDRETKVWRYFREHESAFYKVGDRFAPTWIAEKTDEYGPDELNKRAPYKDCVAIARIWRYDALMRRRRNDGEGIYRTIGYANALFDRPSGGGGGWFAERYGLGRFQPGDEAQATVPKYAGYPAVYNSFVVQQALLGLSADAQGVIHIAPCVPESWYVQGFGQSGCHVLHRHHLGFTYRGDLVEGQLSGPAGTRALSVQLPPRLTSDNTVLAVNGDAAPFEVRGRRAVFTVVLNPNKRVRFSLGTKE